MTDVAVFISDLHMGRGDQLDGFAANEDAFVAFIDEQQRRHAGKKVDLVLLGDALDIWQVATDDEKYAVKAKNIDVRVDPALEAARAQQIVEAHAKAFDALNRFVDAAGRRIVFVTGNHDHSLVAGEVQAVVRAAVCKRKASLARRLEFAHFYDQPLLQAYAEHGSQYDANNSVEPFAHFGQESAGFYFVRLFWNRLETQRPHLEDWRNSWTAIWQNKLYYLLPYAYRFFSQYQKDKRVKRYLSWKGLSVSVAPLPFGIMAAGPGTGGGASSAAPAGPAVADFPDVLLGGASTPSRIFSSDATTENHLRRVYHDPDPANDAFRKEIDAILAGNAQPDLIVPKTPLVTAAPGGPTLGIMGFDFGGSGHGPSKNRYAAAADDLFAGANESRIPLKGSQLEPGKYEFVLFGHTHEELQLSLDTPGATYINTGAWTSHWSPSNANVSRPWFVTLERSGKSVSASEKAWT